MINLHPDLMTLACHLKQEKLYIESEKQQIRTLNEDVLKIVEEIFHASWIRGEQRKNFDDLIFISHASPSVACFRSNSLDNLSFVNGCQVLGSNECLYGDLISVLQDNPRLCAQLLIIAGTHSTEIAKAMSHTLFYSIFASCVLPEDESHILLLMKHLIELQFASHENPRRLLHQGSCSFNQIYRAYVDSLPQAKPLIQLLMEDELYLEIDPSKAVMRFQLEERQRRFGPEGTAQHKEALIKYRAWAVAKLVKITKRFIKSFHQALHSFPPSLLWLVRTFYEVLVTSKMNTKEVSAICVDLVFGFFICHALVEPEVHGICDFPISRISRFNLMQVAQILQVLAMEQWEKSDPKLSDLYSHFDKEISSFVELLIEQGVSDLPPISVSESSTPFVGLTRSSCIIPEHHLYSLINFIQNVIQSLPEDNLGRKELENALFRIPKSQYVNRIRNNHSPGQSPSPSPKKNILSRVKSSRKPENKSVHVQPEFQNGFESLICNNSSDRDESSCDGLSPNYESVLVINLGFSSIHQESPGMASEEKVLIIAKQTRSKQSFRVRMNIDEESSVGSQGRAQDGTVEKRTRFSLSHEGDGSIGNTSDNLEAVSEAASNHSMASSLDDEQVDQPDNLSDMVSANVSGRGTPNVSGRDTPSSQVTEGEAELLRSSGDPPVPTSNIPVTVAKSASADIEDKFGKFEIKPLMSGGGDETVSHVSDTWSTDVLASDSEADGGHRGTDSYVNAMGEQFQAEGLFDRHLQELETAANDSYLGTETFDTASEAWSTDVLLASDSERLEFDTDDAQSVARSDETGRSEIEPEVRQDDVEMRLHSEVGQEMDTQDSVSDQKSVSSMSVADGSPKVTFMDTSSKEMEESHVHFRSMGAQNEFTAAFNAVTSDGVVHTIAPSGDTGSASQSLGRLSLNLSSLSSNGILSIDQPLLLQPFVPRGELSAIIDKEKRSSIPQCLLGNEKGSAEDAFGDIGSLHVSTNSLASSTSESVSCCSESDIAQRGELECTKMQRSNSNASTSDISSQHITGAIPKSISFDQTADRSNLDDSKKKGFFKGFKLPGFKVRRKTVNNSRCDDHSVESRLLDERKLALESSDDILAKYRRKRTDDSGDNQICSKSTPILSSCLQEDERLLIDANDIESSFAFADAKRKLRKILSIADLGVLLGRPDYLLSLSTNESFAESDIIRWLTSLLAEARHLQDRALQAQIHETLRCMALFDRRGHEQLVQSMKNDMRSRSPYVAYLVSSKQGLLCTLDNLQKMLSRLENDKYVITNSLLNKCVRMFLEQQEEFISNFSASFTQLTASDEKVQLLESFLCQIFSDLEKDPIWSGCTQMQLSLAQASIERSIVSHIYIHALYPNGDGDVSRDQVLHEHIKKLAQVITPSHKDLRILKIYHYECPWPSAQAEISCINAFKTARDKLACVVRTCQVIMNLLSISHEGNIPAADDFTPVLVYVLIMANPPSLLSTVQYINMFYEQHLEGEANYWWTQFCSAIEFIKMMDYVV